MSWAEAQYVIDELKQKSNESELTFNSSTFSIYKNGSSSFSEQILVHINGEGVLTKIFYKSYLSSDYLYGVEKFSLSVDGKELKGFRLPNKKYDLMDSNQNYYIISHLHIPFKKGLKITCNVHGSSDASLTGYVDYFLKKKG